MTRIFNRQRDKEKRRYLRNNMTKAEVFFWLQLKNRKMLGKGFCGSMASTQMWRTFVVPNSNLLSKEMEKVISLMVPRVRSDAAARD